MGLKILTGEGAAVDTTRPQGRMIFGILAVMAEFEREMIAEGRESQAGAASLLGVGVATLRRALNEADDLAGSPARGKRPAPVRAGKRI